MPAGAPRGRAPRGNRSPSSHRGRRGGRSRRRRSARGRRRARGVSRGRACAAILPTRSMKVIMRTDASRGDPLGAGREALAGAAGETGLAAVLATSWFAGAAGAAVVPEGAVVAPPAAPAIAEGRGARGGETGIPRVEPVRGVVVRIILRRVRHVVAASVEVATPRSRRSVALGGAGGTAAGFAGRSSSVLGRGGERGGEVTAQPEGVLVGGQPRRSVASLIAFLTVNASEGSTTRGRDPSKTPTEPRAGRSARRSREGVVTPTGWVFRPAGCRDARRPTRRAFRRTREANLARPSARRRRARLFWR